MEALALSDQARDFVWKSRAEGRSIGLVPTMGALHDGHMSLVRMSRQQCDETIVSIFVNPTQFGPGEDLDKYPRTMQEDCRLLEDEGVAAVYVPNNESMYPDGFSTYVDPPEVARTLEGVCRPGHFRGVTTVVTKLFQAVPATHAFFGRKDYQQWKVIEAMTRDLDIGIKIVAGDIVRESDGLALSSRNRYLTADQRSRGLLLSQSLKRAEQEVLQGQRDVAAVETAMRRELLGEQQPGVDKIDYAVLVDAETLSPLAEIDRPAVALIAAFVGTTRLIDNSVLQVPH